jgi:hypothetical protein
MSDSPHRSFTVESAKGDSHPYRAGAALPVTNKGREQMGKSTSAGLGRGAWAVLCGSALAMTAPAAAQIRSIDPNNGASASPVGSEATLAPPSDDVVGTSAGSGEDGTIPALPAEAPASPAAAPPPAGATGSGSTYKHDDLIGAAEGVFGKGAKGLAGLLEDVLKKQGEPNGYIVGREAGAAIGIGLRYGSGTLYHKVEGERPVYWTGPSIGFDAGANAGSTFVLVYNLNDSEDLYKRYLAGEGQAYLVGGFNASYLRAGDVVLIPVRMGVGLRLGVNAGYMKFSHKQNWLPF